jgi:hypothetical protein
MYGVAREVRVFCVCRHLNILRGYVSLAATAVRQGDLCGNFLMIKWARLLVKISSVNTVCLQTHIFGHTLIGQDDDASVFKPNGHNIIQMRNNVMWD